MIKKSGILLVNKPRGITSSDYVFKIKDKYNLSRVGHTGTLDKFAEGLLIILINNANKINNILMNTKKIYYCEISLGYFTDTFDASGNKFNIKKVKLPSKYKMEKILHSMLGDYYHIPPITSAIKYNGKRLAWYFYTKNYSSIDIKKFARIIKIYKINIKKYSEKLIALEIECSKGTYIRGIIRDILLKINNSGYISKLIRIKNGIWELKDAKTITDLDINRDLISLNKILNCPEINYSKNIYISRMINKCMPICLEDNYLKYDNIIIVSNHNKAIYKKTIMNMYTFYFWENYENY